MKPAALPHSFRAFHDYAAAAGRKQASAPSQVSGRAACCGTYSMQRKDDKAVESLEGWKLLEGARALTYAVRRSAQRRFQDHDQAAHICLATVMLPVETTMTETRWPELPNPSPSCLWELSQLE